MAKKIGYVLSGGGARGFAHLGILKFLEELGIKPYAIAGTSAGAIAGTLYAAGKTPEEILNLVKSRNLFSPSSLLWRKSGFFSMEILESILKETIETDDFNALNIKMFITASDLNKGQAVIFSEGELFRPVIASASIPVIFEPVIMNDKVLIDGGLLNDLPIEPLQGICDIIIGSFVNKIEDGIGKSSRLQTFNILERCFHLAISKAVYDKAHLCDLFIETPLHAYGMYDVKKADLIFEAGYNEAVQNKSTILKLIEK